MAMKLLHNSIGALLELEPSENEKKGDMNKTRNIKYDSSRQMQISRATMKQPLQGRHGLQRLD